MATTAIGSCSAPLRKAIDAGVFDSQELTGVPVAQFYDLDLWDEHCKTCKEVFGPTVTHMMAIKSCPMTKMLQHAHEKYGFGIEAASIGEVKQALDNCNIPASHIVFDSPAKTKSELEFGIRQKIHTNFDNFVEYERAKKIIDSDSGLAAGNTGYIGFRINPLVGAGSIAALSVSTSDGKFGVLVSEKEKLIRTYKESSWLNAVHVHVGSGGMGVKILSEGIRVATDLAKEINAAVGKAQVKMIDIGGGLPANYSGDEWAAEKVPTFTEYATHLKQAIPELFSGEFKVCTEFGQSMFAKSAFLASRIEWMKGSAEKPIAIIHFGADCCPRQAYTQEHKRRVEAYRSDGSTFPADASTKPTAVAGPLCFQGDFITKETQLPGNLGESDIVVMKDAGSNTLSMFSRHCSRLCPPVYGYRWAANGKEVSELVELKPRESLESMYNFWGRGERRGVSALDWKSTTVAVALTTSVIALMTVLSRRR